MGEKEISKFLNPKSIALIGASNHEDKVGGILLKKLLNFKGKIIPINPSHEELFGLKCYKSVLNYENIIDLAIIAIPKEFVADSLEQCGKKSIKNVIIISAGFAESGNIKEEEKLAGIAMKHGIRFIGPNCFGIFSPLLELDCTFSKTTPKKGNIAFISQSGALWSYIADFSSGKFGFSGFVSLGNVADLGFSDFIEYFSSNQQTDSIVLYIEKLRDGKKFIESCKKSKKKIYAVKAGKSEQGSKAAFSHTGSLATDYNIYRGALKQAGVELCSSLLEAFSKASGKNLIKNERARIGKEAIIITNAGGAGALAADYLHEKGTTILQLFDILGTAKSFDYKKALEENKNKSDDFVVISTPQSMTDMEEIAKAIIDFKKMSGKNVLVLLLGEKSIGKATALLKKNNIPVFNTLEALAS